MQKVRKDVFLVCLINKMNEFYEERYTGPEEYRELMRAKHIEVMERAYLPERYGKPGHPTREEKNAFLYGVQQIVEHELKEMVVAEEVAKAEAPETIINKIKRTALFHTKSFG